MKRPLKAHEVAFVLIPALGLGGFAWYQKRVEQVSGPDSREMFVSSVELLPATSQAVSQGTSHTLSISIDHPWPKPSWWARGQEVNHEVDALSPTARRGPLSFGRRGTQELAFFSSGGALTWMHNGKPERIHIPGTSGYGYGRWKDGRCVFTHSLSLQNVPANLGELTFHGLYLVGAQPPIRITRVIRKAGEVLPFNHDRSPGGKILSIHAPPFKAMMWSNAPATDETRISILISHPLRPDGQRASASDTDLQLLDAQGRAIKFDQKKVTQGWSAPDPKNITPTTTERVIWLSIDRTVFLPQPLTLRGQVVIDDHWPIPFSVRLPSR